MAEPSRVVRKANLKDLDAIRSITTAAYEGYVSLLHRQPTPMHKNYARSVAEGQVWVVDGTDAPVAMIVLEEEAPALLIYSIAVAPEHQSQGLGRHLFALCRTSCTNAESSVSAAVHE